jgi:tetratricopeptide (TPR) repeat protein
VTALLCLLIAALPWFEGGAAPTGLFAGHTLVMGLVALALLRAARRGMAELRAGWEAAAGLALVAACLVSFLGVDYRFGSFLTLLNVGMAAALAAALTLAPPDRLHLPAATAAASSALQALLAFFHRPVANTNPAGSFANANHLAAYLVLGFLLAVGLASRARRREEAGGPRVEVWLWAMVAAIDAAALLWLGSRGALLSLMGAGALWVVRHRPRGRRARALLAAAALALVAVSAVSVAARFRRFDDPYRYDRVRIWQAGLQAAADHPLTGMGPGMFSRRGAPYNFPQDTSMFRFSKTPGSTHSTWLQALVETGLPGLAAALLFAALLAAAAWRAAPRGSGPIGESIALALPAVLLQAAVDMPFDAPAITLTLVALVWPRILPRSLPEAPWGARWSWDPRAPRPRAVAAAALAMLAVVHAAAVSLPWAAHLAYLRALRQPDPMTGVTRAIRLEPWNPLYPSTRAELIARGRAPLDAAALAEAHLDLRASHRIDPGNPDHLVAMGRLHARACFDLPCDAAVVARAERAWRDAIALGRKDPRPHAELASFLFAVGRPADAAAWLERAVELEPRFVEGWLFLARARLAAGDEAGAMDAARRLERAREELAGYEPRNGYERDLMRLDAARVREMERRLGTAPEG